MCTTGTYSRTRTCSDPAAANGGADCPTDVAGASESGTCLNLAASCIPDTDCFFEDDCVGWDLGGWTKRSGATPSSGTGPSVDYTDTEYPALGGFSSTIVG